MFNFYKTLARFPPLDLCIPSNDNSRSIGNILISIWVFWKSGHNHWSGQLWEISGNSFFIHWCWPGRYMFSIIYLEPFCLNLDSLQKGQEVICLINVPNMLISDHKTKSFCANFLTRDIWQKPLQFLLTRNQKSGP